MANENTVTIVGNVTEEPNLRFTASGKPVAAFTVAANRKWDGGEATTFARVTAWDSLGENAAESLPKGARVVVLGRLDENSYETAEGDKRSYLFITAEAIGPDLRFATAEVTKAGKRQRASSDSDNFDPFEEA